MDQTGLLFVDAPETYANLHGFFFLSEKIHLLDIAQVVMSEFISSMNGTKQDLDSLSTIQILLKNQHCTKQLVLCCHNFGWLVSTMPESLGI